MVRHRQLELDLQLCFPLYAASRALTRAYAPLLEPHGLTYPQYLTMLALWSDAENMRVGDIGRRLRLDSGTITPLLKRLETAGLVRRHRDRDDERQVVVSLTDAGERLQDDLAHVPGAVMERIGMTANEGAALRSLVDKLLASLDHTDDAAENEG